MAVVPISTSHLLTSTPLWRSPSLSLSLSASPSSCSSSCVLFGSSAIRRASSLSAASPFVPSNKLRLEISCAGGRDVSIPLEQRWMFEPSEVNGPDIWNKTWYPKASDHDNKKKTWYIVDATDKILGRMASTIAIHMRGKNLVTFTPSVDMGAYVIVVNAEKVAVSGKKRSQKLYRRHSGRPGGMKIETFDQLQKRIPERIVEHAVRGMLPKGRLGRTLFTHLKVYKGPDHPHEAQKPKELPIHDKRILATK